MIGSFKNPAREKSDERATSAVRPATSREAASKALQSDMFSLQRAVGNYALSNLVRTANDQGGGLPEVHVHTGKDADSRTETQGAIAFASGRDVYVDSGLDLKTGLGQRVLAHELTHVIQQERGRAGLPLGSQVGLEGEASYVSGLGTGGAMDAGGAAVPGSVQKLERQGIPSSAEEKKRWDAELEADAQKLTKILSSTFYSDDDETEAVAILDRWARRQSETERKASLKAAGSLDQGAHLGIRSDYLDRLFDQLRSTRVWTRYGRTTAYEAMFEHFDPLRAQQVRTIRDTNSVKYVGREEEADKAREEKRQEDLTAEGLFGYQANSVEPAAPASSPPDKGKAAWVIRRLAELQPNELTPQTRLLSEGVARERRDFLLKRTHVVTAGDRLRSVKGAVEGAVVTMLEFALWELGMAAAEAVLPDLLAGLGGAEAAGAEGAVAKEGEIAAQTGAPEALGENVTSIVGKPRTGTFEGLSGEGEVIDINRGVAAKGPEPTPPNEPISQALPKAAHDNVEVALSNENQIEVGVKKAVNAGEYSPEPTVSMAGKTGSKPLYSVPKSPGISAEISGEATPLEGSLSAPKTKRISSEAGSAEQEASRWQPIDENGVPRSEIVEPLPAVPEPTQIPQKTKTLGRKPTKQVAPEPAPKTKRISSEAGSAAQERPAVPEPTQILQAKKPLGRKPPNQVAPEAGAAESAAREGLSENVTSKRELELSYGTSETAPVPDGAFEPEIDLSTESGLELEHGPRETAPVSHAEFEPQIDLTKESGLELGRSARARQRASRIRTTQPEFGKAPGEISGTGRRKGIHFNELNEAEIGPGRLRIEYDAGAGRPAKVKFELNDESLAGTQQTDRYFRGDPTVEGPQPHTDDFLNSGYERGHLAPREAFKTSADAERLVDQTTNIVPMRSELNQGVWRQAETRANALAKQYNGVKIEIETIYGPNPKTIGRGVPVPTAFRRSVYTLDGKLLEDLYYLNY